MEIFEIQIFKLDSQNIPEAAFSIFRLTISRIMMSGSRERALSLVTSDLRLVPDSTPAASYLQR